MQNIGADNAGDAFYRYKMPKLVAKVEGRGNGIKTNVVNNVDIARALDRPPTYTLKHFGCELGAQTNFNKETGTSIVNGAHDGKKLSEVLELFIKRYVQCYSCGNPETVVKIRKECIHLKCKACGHTSDVDMREKLTTFMLKNPPENKLSKSEEKVKKAERERTRAAEKEARRAEKAEAKEKRKKDRKDSKDKAAGKGGDESGDGSEERGSGDGAGGGDASDGGDDDDDGGDATQWRTDISADAVAARQRELTSAAAALVQGADAAAAAEKAAASADSSASSPEKAPAPPVDDAAADDEDVDPETAVRRYIAARKAPLGLPDVLAALEVPGGAIGRMKVFYAALLGGGGGGRVVERMQAADKYVLAMAREDAQQAAQLIALEHHLTQVEPERMGEMPFALKWLYEEDLISEDIIVAWGDAPAIAKKAGVDKAAAAAIREASQKVLDWLQQESDDDEE